MELGRKVSKVIADGPRLMDKLISLAPKQSLSNQILHHWTTLFTLQVCCTSAFLSDHIFLFFAHLQIWQHLSRTFASDLRYKGEKHWDIVLLMS
jgi:hypothetical protein